MIGEVSRSVTIVVLFSVDHLVTISVAKESYERLRDVVERVLIENVGSVDAMTDYIVNRLAG